MRAPTASTWTIGERKLLEEGLFPSPHSIDLERTVISDFMHRFTACEPHVAELYHENSKLSPSSTLAVPVDGRKLEEVREWYFSTAYDIGEDEVDPENAADFRWTLTDLPGELPSLLEPFSRSGSLTNLLYAVDLLVLHNRRLVRLVARSRYLWVERTLTEDDLGELEGALITLDARTLGSTDSFLFLVACPWRYMAVFGPRGYRHTLFDCGRLLSYFEGRARRGDIDLAVAEDFYDWKLDGFLGADGVERSTVAVLAILEEAL